MKNKKSWEFPLVSVKRIRETSDFKVFPSAFFAFPRSHVPGIELNVSNCFCWISPGQLFQTSHGFSFTFFLFFFFSFFFYFNLKWNFGYTCTVARSHALTHTRTRVFRPWTNSNYYSSYGVCGDRGSPFCAKRFFQLIKSIKW